MCLYGFLETSLLKRHRGGRWLMCWCVGGPTWVPENLYFCQRAFCIPPPSQHSPIILQHTLCESFWGHSIRPLHGKTTLALVLQQGHSGFPERLEHKLKPRATRRIVRRWSRLLGAALLAQTCLLSPLQPTRSFACHTILVVSSDTQPWCVKLPTPLLFACGLLVAAPPVQLGFALASPKI